MSDWLVEQGIAEERAIRLDSDHVTAAAIRWPGGLETGLVADAVLVSRHKGSTRGTARFPGGEEALVDRLPKDAAEGATLRLAVSRPAIAERDRAKLAQARPTVDAPRPAPTLAETLDAKIVPRFPHGAWEDVAEDAWDARHALAGGALQFSPTPAMTLVDVDGAGRPQDLALAAAAAIGPALARFDIGGSVGVDFPTLPDKTGRKAVDEALGTALADYDCERTGMNGFGFVQIVARLARPSILHRFQLQPAQAAARLLLRRAELVADPGAILLTAPPAVLSALRPEWLEELVRRTGRDIRTSADPALAPRGAFAQAVPR